MDISRETLLALGAQADYAAFSGNFVNEEHVQQYWRDIAQERKKAVNDLKNEIGGIAVDIAGKVVEREINETDHKALIDEFIRNVGDAS